MDEMEVLTRLRAEVPAAVTSRAEDRFLAAIRTRPNPQVSDGEPHASRAIARLRTNPAVWLWAAPWKRRLAIAAGLAVALAAGFVVRTAEVGGGTPPAAASAVVLVARTAAAHAAALPQVPAGQWVYSKTLDRTEVPGYRELACVSVINYRPLFLPPFAWPPASAGKSCSVNRVKGIVKWVTIAAFSSTQQQESWSTADGTRNASYQHGRLVISAACPCGFVTYEGLATIPRDPKALVRYLMRAPGGQQGHWTTADGAWNAFNGIVGALISYAVPPKVAAELYLALADIPGVTVDKNALDAAGRRGPALVLTKNMPGGPWITEIFLNPRTYQLMGDDERFPVQCQCPSPGSGETAILRQAPVSGPGVRP